MHSNIYWVPTISQHDARVSLRKSHIFVPSNYLPADLLYCYMYVRWHIPYSQSYGFSSSHVWMWELNRKESWVLKNWCFWTVVLEKTLTSPLDSKEIKPVNPKGNQPWIFIGKTDAEAETPILWPPDAKNWLIWKKTWCWERLKVGGGGDDRGWDGWMASRIRWTWVWVNSGSWWWTGRPGMLQSMGSQSVRHDWATELNWTEVNWSELWSSYSVFTEDWRSPKR